MSQMQNRPAANHPIHGNLTSKAHLLAEQNSIQRVAVTAAQKAASNPQKATFQVISAQRLGGRCPTSLPQRRLTLLILQVPLHGPSTPAL